MSVKKSPKKGNAGAAHLPHPGPGRPKGIPNKLSRTAKETIQKVFEELGDWGGMKRWAEKSERNLTVFYSEIFPKLIPLDVSHSGEIGHTVQFIMPRPGAKKT